MAIVRSHRSIHAGQCFIKLLADELSQASRHLDTHPTSTLMILPTRRLQLHLTKNLIALNGLNATYLPRMMTWEQFLWSIPSSPEVTKSYLRQISSDASEIILEALLEKKSIPRIPSQKSHEIIHFLDELYRHNKRSTWKKTLQDVLQNQWYMSAEALSDLHARIDDLDAVLNSLESCLAKSTIDYNVSEKVACEHFQYVLDLFTKGLWRSPYKRIIMAGITSLTWTQEEIFKILVSDDSLRIKNLEHIDCWLDETWEGLSPSAPLWSLRCHAGLKSNYVSAQSVSTTAPNPWDLIKSNVKILGKATDITSEVAWALAIAKDLNAKGMPWHRIQVVVTNETEYRDVCTVLTRELGIPTNIPLSQSWSATVLGQWFELVASFLQDGFTADFVSLATHPITYTMLGSSASEHARDSYLSTHACSRFLQRWSTQAPECLTELCLTSLVQSLEKVTSQKVTSQKVTSQKVTSQKVTSQKVTSQNVINQPDQKHVDYARQVYAWVQSWRSKSRAEIFVMIQDLVKQMEQLTHFIKEQQALSLFKKCLDEFTSLNSIIEQIYTNDEKHKNTAASIFESLLKSARKESLRNIGEPMSGLQIISLTEARYVPCDVSIFLGMIEGFFPRALPKDSMIDDKFKQVIGLPSWKQLEALEETTFTLLASRVSQIVLLWPEFAQGSPTSPSRWVERLVFAGVPLSSPEPLLMSRVFGRNFVSDAPMHRLEDMTEIGKLTPSDEALTVKKLSPYSAAALSACPYQYLIRERGLKAFKLRDDEDPLRIGQKLHKIIEKSLALAKVERTKSLKTSLSRDYWQNVLIATTLETLTPSEMQSPLVLEVVAKGWPSLAGFFVNQSVLGFEPELSQSEFRFGDPHKTVYLDPAGPSVDLSKNVKLTGVVDLIQENALGPLHIIDFKTSSSPKSSDIKAGLVPQLVLYAVALSQLMNKDLEMVMVSYFILTSGDHKVVGTSPKISEMLGTNGPKTSLSDLVSLTSDLLKARIKTIRDTSQFELDTSHCQYCEYAGVCRKDDPRRGPIAMQAMSEEEGYENES